MTRKLLPLPIGEDSPQGSKIRFWHQYGFGRQLDSGLQAVALAMAAAGAWLGLHPATVTVAIDAAGYHLGGTTLPGTDGARFGGDLALVIHRQGTHVRAASAGRIRGKAMEGSCVNAVDPPSEHCTFVLAGSAFSATDVLVGDSWRRTYDDGRVVEIRVADPHDPPPVPVPIGHE